MRQSARDAINNFDSLANVFRYKQFFEDTNRVSEADFTPSVSKMPAIIVYPAPSTMPWILHSAKEVKYVLQIDIYTPHWNLPPAEELYWDVCRALYQAAATTGGTPYVKAATGRYPSISGFTIEQVLLGEKNRATKASFTCTLEKPGVNPITQS